MQMDIRGKLNDRVHRHYYLGGHMMYTLSDSMERMNDDIGKFVRDCAADFGQ